MLDYGKEKLWLKKIMVVRIMFSGVRENLHDRVRKSRVKSQDTSIQLNQGYEEICLNFVFCKKSTVSKISSCLVLNLFLQYTKYREKTEYRTKQLANHLDSVRLTVTLASFVGGISLTRFTKRFTMFHVSFVYLFIFYLLNAGCVKHTLRVTHAA